MRITNTMMITNMLSNLGNNLNVMSRKQDELATGKRVIRASDDPVAAAKIIRLKADLADMDQYSTNTRDSQTWLDTSESTISEMGSVLQRVRELAVQAANGTYTVNDTTKMKEEIEQLRDTLISSGNFNLAGKYIFSSNYTDTALLNADGTYNIPITQEDIDKKPVAIYEISSNEYLPVGTHGLDIFGYVTETGVFQSKLTTADSTSAGDVTATKAVAGVAAQKSYLTLDVSKTTNYTTDGDFNIGINGTNYKVNSALLQGSATSPLTSQKILDTFRDATSAAPVKKLSDVADVYYDKDMKLVIRNKTIGAAPAGSVTGPLTVATSTLPTGITGSATAGVNATAAVINGSTSGPITNADVAGFKGKQFVMTYNGLTKTITIPNSASITDVTTLNSAVKTQVDTAFGTDSGGNSNVVVNLGAASGTPMFTTNTLPTDTEVPSLRIQPVVVTECQMVKDLNEFIGYLNSGDTTACSGIISKIDTHINQLLAVRADIGARGTRLELINDKIAENSVTFTRLLSDSQDADMSEVIMYLKNAENVYKAALAVGGRIIQQTLVDFL